VLWTREVLVLRNTETPAQVDILRRRIRRATRVSLDCTGPGVGLGDYLKREFGQWLPGQHSYGRVELCTFSVALKREIFPLLRRQFAAPAQVRVADLAGGARGSARDAAGGDQWGIQLLGAADPRGA